MNIMLYQPGIDITVAVFSAVILILEKTIYTEHNYRYRLVIISLINLILACANSIIFNYYILPRPENFPEWVIYTVHNTMYSQLILELLIFYCYIMNLVMCESKRVRYGAYFLTVFFTAMECVSNVTHIGFYIDEVGNIIDPPVLDVYRIAYCTFLAASVITIIVYNKVVIARLYFAVIVAFFASSLTSLMGAIYNTSSFNTMTYLMPIVVIICLFHSNSYNSIYGLLNVTSYHARVSHLINKHVPFTIVDLYIPNFEQVRNDRNTISAYTQFVRDINYQDFLFEVDQNEYILLFTKKLNTEQIAQKMNQLHQEFHLSHKMVVIHSEQAQFTTSADYIREAALLRNSTSSANLYVATLKDFETYKKRSYISAQLDDIVRNCDLEDPRVKVYCQPILNISMQGFTSAESLMRLELPELGVVFPDQFIPLAEEKNCIHTLSMIILNKVCKYIEDHGDVERISVNFSMLELAIPTFVSEVSDIICSHNIDHSKIGFEITESIDINDFLMIQQTLERIKDLGITIYLDDFGTGYSNLEHIIKLPIDIIKFDRSLVISSAQSKKSMITVTTQAELFKNIGYKILYEGIETEEDQDMCTHMSADYLQGYRYSKPIPIESLWIFTSQNVLCV